MATQDTPNYGFTRVGEGESASKNGYAVTDLDLLVLDDILRALEDHDHNALPKLGDPLGGPTLSILADQGSLPASTTFYYCASYVDAHGLETASSPEVAITTGAQMAPPSAPAANVLTGGQLLAGFYTYALTAVSATAGGETSIGALVNVRVPSGSASIALTLPTLPAGAFSLRIYRTRPGQTELYLLAEIPGLATLATPVIASVTTATTGGTLPAGTNAYRVSATSSAGETLASAEVTVVTTGTTSSNAITWNAVAGATGYKVYGRTIAGELFMATTTTTTTYTDTGAVTPLGALPTANTSGTPGSYTDGGTVAEDATIVAPSYNTTNNANAIQITIPGGVLPAGVSAWNIYRTVTPGSYTGSNLVHRVVEGLGELANQPRVVWIDDGSQLLRGVPRRTGATVSGGRSIVLDQLGGKFPLSALPRGGRRWDTYAPVLTPGQIVSKTSVYDAISPSQLTAFFQTPPVVDPNGAQVGFEVIDSAGTAAQVVSDGTNSGYYVGAYPLTVKGLFQAEATQQANWMDITILNDILAGNGQYVQLHALNDYVQISLGVLDQGDYEGYSNINTAIDPNTYYDSTATASDLTFSALIGTTVIASSSTVGVLTPAQVEGSLNPTPAYPAHGPLHFTVPAGGAEVILEVQKVSSNGLLFGVDTFNYISDVKSFVAGTLTLRATLGESPSAPLAAAASTSTAAHLVAPTRVLAREGIETSVRIPYSASDGSSPVVTVAAQSTWLGTATVAADAVTLPVTYTGAVGSRTSGSVTLGVRIATPVNSPFSTATTGGTLTSGTYGYRVSATNASGETLASTETSIVVPATTTTNTVTVNWGAVTGATGYRVYGRTVAGELFIAATTTATTYIDTGAVVPAGALPATNTAAATGPADAVVEVVALRAPTTTGSVINISVQY